MSSFYFTILESKEGNLFSELLCLKIIVVKIIDTDNNSYGYQREGDHKG